MAIDFPNSPTNGQEYSVGLTTWVYDGAKWNVKSSTAYSNESAPIGTVVNFAGGSGSIPTGWIACDGSAISRSTYATLFSIVGTTYGAGNGSTTFNVPTINSSTGVFMIRWTATLGTQPAWTSWAPMSTGLDSLFVTETAKYYQIGKTVWFRYLAVGSSMNWVVNSVSFQLPVAGAVSDYYPLNCVFRDESAGKQTPGVASTFSGSVYINAILTNSTYAGAANLSSSIPFTWDTGDRIHVSGFYEVS